MPISLRHTLALAGAALIVAACQGRDPVAELAPATGDGLQINADGVRLRVLPQQGGAWSVDLGAAADRLTVTREGEALVIADRSNGKKPKHCGLPAGAPLVTVRAPAVVHLEADGAVFGEIGPATELRLTNRGCGAWQVGPIASFARLAQVEGGKITVASVTGRMMAIAYGPKAQVEIQGGVTQRADLRVIGSGKVAHKGQVGTLVATQRGPGRIEVAVVTGQVEKSTEGTGDVAWGRPQGRTFCGGVSCMR